MASDSDLDLAALAAAAERDPTIEWLIDLAEGGFAVPVTLVVNGLLITGAPVREENWGAALDRQVEAIVTVAEEHARRAGDVPDEQAAAFAAIRGNRLTEALARRRELRARLGSEIESNAPDGDWSPKDLPGDLGVLWAREQTRATRFLTLTGASILIPPGRREDVGTVRVDIDHIGAWWPAQFETRDEDGEDGGGGEAEAA